MSRSLRVMIVAAALAVLAIRLARPVSTVKGYSEPTAEVVSLTSGVPPVRVLLGGRSRPVWQISVDGPYRVTSADAWTVMAQGDELSEVDVAVGEQGLRLGTQEYRTRKLRLEVRDNGSLWVGTRRYRGDLFLVAQPDRTVSVINVVGVEQYLASVLPSEMPADFPLSAQRAQTIVGRTYALYHMKMAPPNRSYDLLDTPRNQAYLGMEYRKGSRRYAVESPSSRKIVEETRGMVLVYRGRLFATYYSAVCGGHTAAGEALFQQAASPLVGVPCGSCRHAKNFRWEKLVDRAVVETNLDKYLNRLGRPLGKLRDLTVQDVGVACLPRVRVEGSHGAHSMTTQNFRLHVLEPKGIPSPFFELNLRPNTVLVQGRGWGHGVGLCQWGASGQACAGRTCPEILAFYYPGSNLERVR